MTTLTTQFSTHISTFSPLSTTTSTTKTSISSKDISTKTTEYLSSVTVLRTTTATTKQTTINNLKPSTVPEFPLSTKISTRELISTKISFSTKYSTPASWHYTSTVVTSLSSINSTKLSTGRVVVVLELIVDYKKNSN